MKRKIGVKEYGEGLDVMFATNATINVGTYSEQNLIKRDIVLAYNECGYNCVELDARDLYRALKEIYGE